MVEWCQKEKKKLYFFCEKDGGLEKVIRQHNAKIIAAEPDFVVLELTGHKEQTQELLEILKGYGLLEFARSGRVAVAKRMLTIDSLLK